MSTVKTVRWRELLVPPDFFPPSYSWPPTHSGKLMTICFSAPHLPAATPIPRQASLDDRSGSSFLFPSHSQTSPDQLAVTEEMHLAYLLFYFLVLC